MSYIETDRLVPKIWQLKEGLNKTQCIAQMLAMAARPGCHGVYLVIFERDNAHGYQWGLTEDEQFDAVADIALRHKEDTL